MAKQVIIFDAYGTLFNINSIDNLLSDFFGDRSIVVAQTWRQSQLSYTWLNTLMQRYDNFATITKQSLLYALAVHQVSFEDSQIDLLLEKYGQLQVYPEVPAELSKLANHHRLGILSNAQLDWLLSGTNHNDIQNAFEHILSADSIQKYKPTPSVYQIAVSAFQVLPEHIYFISSNNWDVSGAASFGLNAIWLNRNMNQPFNNMGVNPYLEINQLSDLVDRLP